ncbi:outer membrane assembly protein AsmA [Pragia fontium]|uniref:AsmA protein n=1 Tax=Pragia fontium DSM 5563 = ATCC 49100 TaxID=1122977 RepID=A0AAJ5BHF1_9GAMM|nr:outer membrane assembly protein AsmA [Pragia fontium]SFC92027.1 AsmA protein [Pragia fontium DSM 5563 = ATCC 49100]SUB83017.1 putative assembly protein [Pragia fontium]VEJ55916.1 putative assembly protein [Pragia fontium]
MRRLLTVLAIILAVLLAGMAALILLVNPNEFRGYMVKKVEDKTGYQLKIDGDLRWHVWPQLSILAGQMTLTAPGATKPLVSSDNMRLDVELFPLLSHQLVVKNVVLKGGVIQLLPESQMQTEQNAPIAPGNSHESKPTVSASASGWSLELDKIIVTDSLLVWQRSENDIINVRDINLTLSRTEARQADISAQARINRDQRELSFSLDGAVDLRHFPQTLGLDISNIDYQLEGADIPSEGFKGTSAFSLVYQSAPQSIKISPMNLTFNDNQLTLDISASLGDVPQYDLAIKSDSLNLDQIFPVVSTDASTSGNESKETPAPVISSANGLSEQPDLSFLKDFNAKLSVEVSQLAFRNLSVGNLVLKANNQQGTAIIETLKGNVVGGSVSVTGTVDTTAATPKITLKPIVQNVAMGDILKALNYPETLTGQLSLQGTFHNIGNDISRFDKDWQGNAHIAIDGARLHGLNIQQLIQQAVSRSNKDVKGAERYERYTEVQRLVVDTVLNQGQVRITRLNGASEMLAVAGTGVLNLPGKSCDMNLKIRVTQGWSGKSDIVTALQNSTIPLRIYGPWSKLSYQLNVEQLLRDQIKGQVGKAIDKWIDKNKDKKETQEVKKLLDKIF